MATDRFDKRIKISQEFLTRIAEIDRLKGLWQGGLNLNPRILGRLKAWVIITSTGASTRIEGSKMSDEEIARFLRGLRSKPPKNRDEQEVAGYADLIGRIFDNHKTMTLSQGWILQFHEILLHYSEKDRTHKGKYKITNNTVAMVNDQGEQVVLFNPTPPHLVRSELDDIVRWTNEHLKRGDIHPILVIANFIFEFLAIHPFKDGNGRMGRALTNLLLLKSGYPYITYVSLDEIIEETKVDYYLSLRKTQKKHKTDKEDISPWVGYFLSALLEQAKRADSLMAAEHPEKILSETQLKIYGLFNEGVYLAVKDVVAALDKDASRATIKQALSRLVSLKMIERSGQGRGARYGKI